MNITCDTVNINIYGHQNNNLDNNKNNDRDKNKYKNKDKGYIILNPGAYMTVVLFTCNSIFEVLGELEKELAQICQKYEHLILLDQLFLSGSDNDNRYLTIEFRDNKFDITRVKKWENPPGGYYKDLATKYLNCHYYLVENSILPEEYKKKIRNYKSED